MARLGYKLVGVFALTLSGLGMVNAAAYIHDWVLSPRSEHELRRVDGTLLEVSQCIRGRRSSSYNLLISTDTEPISIWQSCPNPWQPLISQSIGRPIYITLNDKLPNAYPLIYTLKIDAKVIRSHEDTSTHLRSVRWMTLMLILVGAGCCLGIMYFGLLALRESKKRPNK